MNINKKKQKLINAVIEQIKKDIEAGDVTALDELLYYVPKKILIQYLPEEQWTKFSAGNKTEIWNSITQLLGRL